jgi:hypothetical protein
MKRFHQWASCAMLAAATALAPAAYAQAGSTASQQLALSAFGAGTGTATGLGKNLAITAGADLAFMTFLRYRPVVELRGTYPIDNGNVAGEKNVLAGLRVERQFGLLHPYVNFLIGRGEIDYKGYRVGDYIYLKTTSTVYSPGFGVDYDLTDHWAVKGDFQLQRWNTPIRDSGVAYAKSVSIGAVYRFDFNPHHRRYR